ncbi:hypothetical protein KTR9_0691 [Gordonia sp. KTR9]|nr:hypothetical protein KTR9_0691 [Gordonia sp. KTR9]
MKFTGAVLISQVTHLGIFGQTFSDPHRRPLWGLSDCWTAEGEGGHRITDDEVEQVIRAYRSVACFYMDVGLGGIEVHGAHGYLIQRALTPRTL